MDTDDDHSDFEPQALTEFTGDYFGNYDEEDFDQFMESDDEPGDGDGDGDGDRDGDGDGDRDGDIVAAHDAEFERGWEFPAGPIPPDIDSDDSEDAVLQPQSRHAE
jgi:hypothetical protein